LRSHRVVEKTEGKGRINVKMRTQTRGRGSGESKSIKRGLGEKTDNGKKRGQFVKEPLYHLGVGGRKDEPREGGGGGD